MSSDTRKVAVSLTRANLVNLENHQPGLIAAPPSTDGVRVQRADGANVEIALVDDAFVFELPNDERYRVSFPTPRSVVEIQSSKSALSFVDVTFGRSDRQIAKNVSLKFEPVSTTGIYNVMSTGVWQAMSAQATTATLEVDWNAPALDGGGPSLVASSKNDQLLLAHYVVEGMTDGLPSLRLADLQTFEIDMQAGRNEGLEATPVTLVPTQVETRMNASAYDSILAESGIIDPDTDEAMTWLVTLRHAPTALRVELGFDAAITQSQLQGVTNFALPAPLTALPYPLYPQVSAFRSRRSPIPTLSFDLTASIVTTLAPDRNTDLVDFDNVGIGIGHDLVVGDTTIGAVPVDIAIDRGGPVRVRWDDVAGADQYAIDLIELDESGVPTLVRTYLTTEPFITIEPELLRAPNYYVLGHSSFSGFPGAATGDFTARSFPSSHATMTAMFRAL